MQRSANRARMLFLPSTLSKVFICYDGIRLDWPAIQATRA
jgi:hypothetical protein